MTLQKILLVLVIALGLGSAFAAQGFKFSNADQDEKDKQAQEAEHTQTLLATPCRAKIKNQKILVLIAEDHSGSLRANQSSYSPHVTAINGRLQNLGLKTYTQEQIRKQVAQAEIDAYFKNDPDAALSASQRLAAQYSLQGVISTQTGYNRIINVNEVSIQMEFLLKDARGKTISQTSATNASYAGADTRNMALTLINEKADEVVAKLYSDYCQRGVNK